MSFMDRPVNEIMVTNLKTLHPEDNFLAVQDLFNENRIHHIPIVEDGKLKGLISKTDFFHLENGVSLSQGSTAEENQRIFEDTKVSEVMTTHLATLEAHQSIGVAAEILLANLFHCVPIVDDQHNIKGLVTSFDIIKFCFGHAYPSQA